MALESSAKARYQPPTSEDTPEIPAKVDNGLKFTENYSIYLKVLKDENLRAAFAAARPGLTQSWLKNELKNATAKNLDTYRESLCSKSQIDEIIEKVQAHAKQPGNAKPDAKVIGKRFRKHPELLEFFVEYALDQRILELEFDESRAHEEIERIMRAENEKWHDYDILCIDKKMKRAEVTRNYRNMLLLVHPDKNKDKDATSCSQIINNAYHRVLKENKNVYEPFQGPRDYYIEDKGRYAAGAYGSDSEDSDDENDGAVKNPDEEIPDVPHKIREVHKKVGKHVLRYFSTFVNDDPPFPDEIRKGNDKIYKLNKVAKRNLEWYNVDESIIKPLRKQLSLFIKSQNTVDAKAIGIIMGSFRTYSRQREYQWPESWGADIEKILRSELDDQANKNHPRTLSNDVDIDMDQKADDADSDTDMDLKADDADSDTDMDLNANENSSQTDSSYGVRGNVAETAIRQIMTLRPGYTLLGDKILGCRVLKRFNRFQNSDVIHSVKFFVENLSSKVFNVFSEAEIGYEAALAYCQLSEKETNNVEIYLNEVSARTLTADMYDRILGVCAKMSQYEMTHRYPETWVHIAVKEMYIKDISKPIIIHRTAFRKLIDHADKRIESFYMDQGIEPPWATTRYPDPKNRVQYMPLLHPAPRGKVPQYTGRQMTRTSPSRHAVGSGETDPARSRLRESVIVPRGDINSHLKSIKRKREGWDEKESKKRRQKQQEYRIQLQQQQEENHRQLQQQQEENHRQLQQLQQKHDQLLELQNAVMVMFNQQLALKG